MSVPWLARNRRCNGLLGLVPFEAERIKRERKLRLAVQRALAAIQKNVIRRLRREARESRRGLLVNIKSLSDVPDDLLFWDEQKGEFLKEVGDLPVDTLLEGAQQAERLGLAIDFDLVNQDVLDFAGSFTNEWWERTAITTRDAMRIAIRDNISTGAPLSSLENNLTPLFGRARAQTIASTEVTRMFAEGNRLSYRSAGVRKVEFQTVRDARVDPICDALQGKKLNINDQSNFPPLHPRCRCWIAPITGTGDVLKRARKDEEEEKEAKNLQNDS